MLSMGLSPKLELQCGRRTNWGNPLPARTQRCPANGNHKAYEQGAPKTLYQVGKQFSNMVPLRLDRLPSSVHEG